MANLEIFSRLIPQSLVWDTGLRFLRMFSLCNSVLPDTGVTPVIGFSTDLSLQSHMLVHWESCLQGSEIPAAELARHARTDWDIRARTTITSHWLQHWLVTLSYAAC